MSVAAYESYRDSSIEWLGAVPSHWRLSKLRYLATFSGGGTPSRDNPKFWGGTLPWVSPKDMKAAVISGAQESITELGLSESSTSLVPPGALLMVVRSGILQHTIPVAQNIVPVALNQDIKALRFGPECQPAFFLRWVQGLNKALLLAWAKQGATVESIEHAYLAETVIPLPPVEEQTAITAFLDRETGKIDSLVEAQRRLIELLKEKRQAIISHTVTKGLDPSVPMKDSGVEWLGEVPAHWEVKAIKMLSPVFRGASPRPIDDPKYFDDEGEFCWVRIADVSASDGVLRETPQRLSDLGSSLSVKLQPGSLFISIAGTVGKPCITSIKACIHDGFVYFPRLGHESDFLYRIFEGGACYAGLGKMGTQLNLNTDTVGSIRIALPGPDEMAEISDYLDRETARISALVFQAEAAVILLQERRAALISAAVTGKIDVRGLSDSEAEAA